MADDKGSSASENGSTAADFAQIIAPLTAVVAVLASLAAAGVISNAQRNHGHDLLWGIELIAVSAALWILALVLPAPKEKEKTPPPSPPPAQFVEGQTPWGNVALTWRTQNPPETSAASPTFRQRLKSWLWTAGRVLRVVLRVAAIALLVLGIVRATQAIIKTQGDSQRPAVEATFNADKGVLAANVTAEGLRTEQRMSVRVDGLQQSTTNPTSVQAVDINQPFYLALLGPDDSGKVAYKFSVYVPPAFNIVGVEAWTAEKRPGCFDVASRIQSQEAGCVIIRLKPRPASVANKAKKKATKAKKTTNKPKNSAPK
jgi:hypothetical protein